MTFKIKLKLFIKHKLLRKSLFDIKMFKRFFSDNYQYFKTQWIFKFLYDDLCIYFKKNELLKIGKSFYNKFSKLEIAERYAALLLENESTEESFSIVQECVEKRLQKVELHLKGTYNEKVSASSLGKVVQISGYFYSGSGAVLDFLKGFRGALKWGPGGEVRIVKFPGGFWEILQNLKSNGMIVQKDLIRLYLHIVGLMFVSQSKGVYSRNRAINKNSRKILKNRKADTYVYELLRIWVDLYHFSQKNIQNQAEFIAIVQKGIHRAFNAVFLSYGVKILLIDQMITAWRIPAAILLPPCFFIVVHRDPRDQYVEARMARNNPGRPSWNVEDFISIYRERRELIDEWVPNLEETCRHSFLRLSFEDFVTDHDKVSAQVISFLNLENILFISNNSKFNPKVSKNNVGKHKKYLKELEREAIESGLKEYLNPAAH